MRPRSTQLRVLRIITGVTVSAKGPFMVERVARDTARHRSSRAPLPSTMQLMRFEHIVVNTDMGDGCHG